MIHAIYAEIHIGKESNSVGSQISPFANSVEAEPINAVYVKRIHASALYLALLMLISTTQFKLHSWIEIHMLAIDQALTVFLEVS